MTSGISRRPGVDSVVRRISTIGERLGTWRSAQREIASAVASEERRWFASRGKGSWPPLSEDYERQKARTHPGQGLLVREEDLIDSLTSIDALMQLRSGDLLVLGTDVEHGSYHATGTRAMPKRNPLIPLPSLRAIARRIVERHVERAVRATR